MPHSRIPTVTVAYRRNHKFSCYSNGQCVVRKSVTGCNGTPFTQLRLNYSVMRSSTSNVLKHRETLATTYNTAVQEINGQLISSIVHFLVQQIYVRREKNYVQFSHL